MRTRKPRESKRSDFSGKAYPTSERDGGKENRPSRGRRDVRHDDTDDERDDFVDDAVDASESDTRDADGVDERGSDEDGGRQRRRRRGGRGRSKKGTPSSNTESTEPSIRKEMLINSRQSEECRIAILENGILEELYTERASQDNYVGNIYKGKVVNLEPSIQAAFVDFGVGKNGFLHISDVESQYFRQGGFNPKDNFGPDGRTITAEEARRA